MDKAPMNKQTGYNRVAPDKGMFNSYSIRIDVEATGRRIRELREQKKLGNAELAEIMHSSENTIYKWQRGACIPTIDNLVVLSELFETPLDEIILVSKD